MGRADRRQPEDLLSEALTDVALGRRISNDAWRNDYGGKAAQDGTGSTNWWLLGKAVEAHASWETVREHLRTVLFPAFRRWFQISELGTLCYGEVHLLPLGMISKAARLHGDREILAEAQACVSLILTLAAARQCPDGRVLAAGMRSQGYGGAEHGQPWYRHALALAGHGSEAAAMAGLRKAGKGPGKSWKTIVFAAIRDELQAAAPNGPPWVLPAGFTGMTGIAVLGCSRGLVTYVDGRNCNSNTGPLMLSVWEEGVISCPTDGRTQHRHIEATCRLDGDAIAWTFDGAPGRTALPGAIEWQLRLPAFDGAAVPVPVPDQPPAPGGVDVFDIEALVAEVAALGAQPDQTEPAVALVRARRWDEAGDAVRAMAVPRKRIGQRDDLAQRLADLV